MRGGGIYQHAGTNRGDSKRRAQSKDKATETDAERGLKRDREENELATYRRC